MDVAYAVRGLRKEFGGRSGVADATLDVRWGSIHGIIGKNGAGKTVLMNMVSGVMEPSGGELVVDGQSVLGSSRWTPALARQHRIALIPQDPPRLPYLTVEDYLFLGDRAFSRHGLLNRSAMRRKVAEIDDRLGLHVSASDPLVALPVETQQLLAFGKAVFLDGARIILLDEITASLSGARRESLLQELRNLASDPQARRSFTVITHHINEVLAACDRVTVMRDGVSVDTLDVSGTTSQLLASKIVGDGGTTAVDSTEVRECGDEILRVTDLASAPAFAAVSMSVRRHEVVGIAGLEGSGKDELLDGLGGLRKTTGQLSIAGRPARIRNSMAAHRAGIAYLPKNRERLATIHTLSVLDNLLLPIAHQFSNWFGLLDEKRMRATAQETIERMEVQPPRADAVINSLSGGNRQKVMVGRLRLMRPSLYVLNEPTRGVDIATKPQLLNVVRHELAAHSAVIMTSESEDELVDICDRVLIFYKGRIVREFERSAADFEAGEIYRACQGVTA